jgi:hypothetical protein
MATADGHTTRRSYLDGVREPTRRDRLTVAAHARRMIPDIGERREVLAMLGLLPPPPHPDGGDGGATGSTGPGAGQPGDHDTTAVVNLAEPSSMQE